MKPKKINKVFPAKAAKAAKIITKLLFGESMKLPDVRRNVLSILLKCSVNIGKTTWKILEVLK